MTLAESQGPPAKGTPRELGYRMPAEWEPHRATWIAWPHHRSDWPGKFEAIPFVYAEIVRWLSRGETAEIVVQGAKAEREARSLLERSDVSMERVRFHRWRTDRSWTRDSGPSFVQIERPRRRAPGTGVVHWKFNAWAKYPNWRNDRQLPAHIADYLDVPRWRPMVRDEWVVLEGGAFDVNGQGGLLATEECLLGSPQARNPGLRRSDVERVLLEQLSADEVIWLPAGVVGDDTHGHIDDVARFVAPHTVVAVAPRDRRDPNYRPLSRNAKALRDHRDHRGQALTVVELPSPQPVVFDGEVLPASYANFYVCNAAVLVPTFNDPADAEALRVLARCFPRRPVVGIAARDLVWGLGTIHCLTQQEPAPRPR